MIGGAACKKQSRWGNWTKEELSLNINVLEVAVDFFAVTIYAPALSEISIHLRLDNTATLAWINRQNAPNETTVHLLLSSWSSVLKRK